MANEVATTERAPLAIAANKIADIYIKDVSNLNAAVGVPMTDEAKRCAVNAVLYLCGEMGASEVAKLPKEQLVQVLQFVTINGLDVFNGQVFLDRRKTKEGGWSVKATPMGSAYEIMTSRFGVNVKTVHPARIVHEGDEFELPQFDGLKMTNVKHRMTLQGLDSKAIAVYYIIEKNDGTLDFAIATREGVGKNLMAQILNASLRDADVNRGELMKKLDGKTLDEILTDPYFAKWISPAYRSPSSRETMIVTKMKKNALMHYTRDLGTQQNKAFAAVNSNLDEDNDMVVSYQEPAPETPAEIPQKAKIQDFDVDDNGVVEEAPKKTAKPQQKEEKQVQAEVVEDVQKPVEEPVKPAPAEEPKPQPKKQGESVSIFDDLDDL